VGMRPLKSLTLEAIVEHLRAQFRAIVDTRAEEQLSYTLPDTLMSGFALMFFQHPSLLQFQRAMEKKRQRCNLQTIFGVHAIPSDTQLREILDGVAPESLRKVLPQLWEKVRRAGWSRRFTTTLPSGSRQGVYQVLPLDVEEVRNATAGSTPQDCELTAAKRLLARVRREHPQMAQIVIGDDLYSHVPLVEQLRPHRQHYILGDFREK
jgi:hypothetical protein